jgi:hypothetical protein
MIDTREPSEDLSRRIDADTDLVVGQVYDIIIGYWLATLHEKGTVVVIVAIAYGKVLDIHVFHRTRFYDSL